MDGVHDLGGTQGFGPVVTEVDEPPFHEPWEGRTHGMMLGVGIARGMRGFRWWQETMGNTRYLTTRYYEHWLHALEQMLIDRGDLVPGDLDDAVRAGLVPTERRDDPEAAAFVPRLLLGVPDHGRPAPPESRFAVGDRVRVVRFVTTHHNRVPRYVRGVSGVIEARAGETGLEEGPDWQDPMPVYSVAFRGSDLWGPDAEPGTDLVVDLFEKYLEPA